jgi:hypothetical protein
MATDMPSSEQAVTQVFGNIDHLSIVMEAFFGDSRPDQLDRDQNAAGHSSEQRPILIIQLTVQSMSGEIRQLAIALVALH